MVGRPGPLQASFNSGELSPELYARSDVKQFYAGAAEFVNAEPVPQGGYRILDRSRDCGGERGGLVRVDGTFSSNAGVVSGGTTVAQIEFAGVVPISIARIVYTASINADARLVVQYRDLGGAWLALGTIGLRMARQDRAIGRPPQQQTTGTAVRLVLSAGASASVAVASLVVFAESADLQVVRYEPFTYNTSIAYLLAMFSNGLADVYRDGAWVGAVWHDSTAAEIMDTQLLQRLDTGLLFHQDHAQRRIWRMSGGDHEWNLEAVAFSDLSPVDLGGDYVKVVERWDVGIRWPTAAGGSAAAYIFTVTVDAQETPAIGIGTPPDWDQTAADLRNRLAGLSTVGDGVTVTKGGSGSGIQFLEIRFAGADAGSQFTVSARVINNTEGAAFTLRSTPGDPGGEPLFSPGRGYPAAGIFYQDRLIQGGFKAKPGAMLASPTGDYYSGNIQVEAASGGILLNLDTDGAEQIVRFARSKHLVVHTTDAEYYIADRNVRRDQPVNVVESSRNGSARGVPICSTETALLYVSRNRSLVYTATYDDVAQAYVSEPLSLLARHLMTGLNGAALQRADDRSDAARYYLTRDDGVMPVGLLIRSQEVTAFVRWLTDGKVRAVAVDGANRVYLSVERTIGGVARRRVERIEPGLLVDGAVTQSFGTPQSVVGGLAMHEGASVWAQADGYWLGPFTVAGAAITLPIAASNVTVGRWTPPRVTTLPMPREVGDRQRLQRPARVHSVSLRVIATTSVAVAANGGKPEDVPLYRAGMATDQQQAPVTEIVLVEGLEGYADDAQVTITQTKPGRLQVAGITVSARI